MNSLNQRPNPYVGPRAFQTGEVLYGRDRDILNLYYLFLAERVVLLFSPSGAGKTSLIQAGLVPRLKEKFSFIPIIRINHEPPEEFNKVKGFNRYVYSALLSLEEITPQENRLKAEELAVMSLSQYLSKRSIFDVNQAETARPVFEALIFDQFEEILTTAPNDYEGKLVFFDQLGETLKDSKRWGLFSARQDYAAAFEPYLRAIPTRFANRYRLDLLDADMALQAIQSPARDVGVDFTDQAAQKLVDDLRRVQTQRPDGTTEHELGRYVETVQLQVVCFRLWNGLSAGEKTISEKQVSSIGSVNDSLSAYYTEQVIAAEVKFNVPQRLIREWFNNQLITKQGIRSQIILEPEKSGGLDNQLIRFLESAHLVRAEKRAGSTWFELSHDRLIEPIRLENERWLKANLSLLQQQADLWNQQDRPDSLLLRENELLHARQWAENHKAELLPYEVDFLLACSAEENRALRLKRRNQIISILGLVAMGLALIAFWAYRQADFQRKEAQRQERVSRAGQLAAQSRSALNEFPQRSLLLALEALNITQNFNEPVQAFAEEALRSAIEQPHGQPLGRQEKPITAVTFSQNHQSVTNNSWLATGSEDGAILLWDVSSGISTASPVTLSGPGGAVRSLELSPDGKWLAASGDNKVALMWNLDIPAAGPIILEGHASDIKSMTFDPDSHWLATGSIDETIRLWDLGKVDPSDEPQILTGHGGDISSLSFSPDGRWLASGSLDSTVRLWDMHSTDFSSLLLEGHRRNVNTLSFSPDGHWLATGSFDHTVRLWDLNSENPNSAPVVFSAHEDTINTLAFSPGGYWLATGSADHTIRLWNMHTSDPAASPLVLRGHNGAINTLAFSPGGEWLATGSADHSIRLWDMTAPDPAAAPGILSGHDDQVADLVFSPDGSWLVSGSRDNSSRLWSMRVPSPGKNPEILEGHEERINDLEISVDGRWLATASSDSTIQLRDLKAAIPPTTYLTLRKHTDAVNTLRFSHSGRWLATAGVDKNILLWDLHADDFSEHPVLLSGHESAVTKLDFSPDESWLASGSQDGSVRLWNIRTGLPEVSSQLLGIDQDHDVTSLAFDPAGKWLAVGSGFIVRIWRVEKPEEAPVVLQGHENRVTSLVFSPDGHWLATGSMDTTIRLYDMSIEDPASSALILSGHSDWVTALAFGHEIVRGADAGYLLASGSKDKTVLLWDLHDTGNPSALLRGHDDEIRAIGFSPDNRWLATAGNDRTVRLWDLRSDDPSENPVVLRGHQDSITSLDFTPRGDWLVTGSEDKTARLWKMDLDEIKNLACDTAGRNLSRAEWQQYFSNREYEITCQKWPAGN